MLNIAQLLNIFQTQLVVRKSPFPGFMGYLRGYPELSQGAVLAELKAACPSSEEFIRAFANGS